MDASITPVAQPHHKILFHLGKKVAAELEDLERKGIFENVEGPTPWVSPRRLKRLTSLVSPIVVAPKPHNPDKIRLCVHMRQANRAIKREHHITLMTDDIIQELNGAMIFSKVDLNQEYYQLELEPESRYITTFSSHIGLRCYTRLNFGISSATEVFQDTIPQVIAGNLELWTSAKTLSSMATVANTMVKLCAQCWTATGP